MKNKKAIIFSMLLVSLSASVCFANPIISMENQRDKLSTLSVSVPTNNPNLKIVKESTDSSNNNSSNSTENTKNKTINSSSNNKDTTDKESKSSNKLTSKDIKTIFFKDVVNGFGNNTFIISQKKLSSILNKNNTVYSTDISIKDKNNTGFNIYNTLKSDNTKYQYKDNKEKEKRLEEIEKDTKNTEGFVGYKISISNFKEKNDRVSFDEKIENNKISSISYNKKKNITNKMLSKQEFDVKHIDIKKDKCFILCLDKDEHLYVAFYLP